VTSKEAAAALGLRARSVRRLAVTGRLPGAVRAGRDWFIPRDAVNAEMARRAATTSQQEAPA